MSENQQVLINPKRYGDARRAIHYYQTGDGYHPGDFMLALIETITKADEINVAKLRTVFPDIVQAVLDDRKGISYS